MSKMFLFFGNMHEDLRKVNENLRSTVLRHQWQGVQSRLAGKPCRCRAAPPGGKHI
jgi:hypothetical protein